MVTLARVPAAPQLADALPLGDLVAYVRALAGLAAGRMTTPDDRRTFLAALTADLDQVPQAPAAEPSPGTRRP